MNRRIALVGWLLIAGFAVAENHGHVAGPKAERRPVNAPVIERFEQSPEWRIQALQGVVPPLNGLDFLKDQGAWYTPFNQPNMPGRYDIRNLYGKDGKN